MYFGRVISVVPGFVNFYNIVYDNDVAEDGVTKCVYAYVIGILYKWLFRDSPGGNCMVEVQSCCCRKQCLIFTFNTDHAEYHF